MTSYNDTFLESNDISEAGFHKTAADSKNGI